MLKGASAYWLVRVKEYQCSCKFINWHYGPRNLGVFPALQPVSSSWSAIQLSNTGCSKNRHTHTRTHTHRNSSKNPAERSRFIHSLKLPFNNKGLAQSELIQNDNIKVKVSETCAKISIIWKCFALYLQHWFMLKSNINSEPLLLLPKWWNWIDTICLQVIFPTIATTWLHAGAYNVCALCNIMSSPKTERKSWNCDFCIAKTSLAIH